MAEIVYRADYGRHQISIDSIAPTEKMGELSLSTTARSTWGGDHVLSQAFVLLTEEDVVALRDALDSCLMDIKERKKRDRANGKTIPEEVVSVQPKKFRPRKRLTPNKKG
ncbi:hypothetical protein PBI_CANTARE_60 [Brevibacterium phage Cantare]|uniref:Uncharacterized protein n=1 Tax=Brevibacterium phage Cantare TaxID=2338395 RepID=A0A3G3LYR1_9CAUD|nr:hypothetical protein PQD70_gp060 [Brevibacterium phage Cantare]AYQ99280.1 hypothetical protein PBI_CANTARE_60 [Brevibacterium phage Cantare]